MQNQKNIVLVVDTNESVRLMLKRTLSPHFAEVLLAEGFAQAIRICRKNEVTHLVTAFVFIEEQLNGFEICAYLKTSYKSIKKTVIYTGADTSLFSELPVTVNAVIAKPGGTEELVNALLG